MHGNIANFILGFLPSFWDISPVCGVVTLQNIISITLKKKQSQLYFFTVLLGITPSLFYKISAHILHCHQKNQIAKGTLLQFKIS